VEAVFEEWLIVSAILEDYACQLGGNRGVGFAAQVRIKWIAVDIVLEFAPQTPVPPLASW
jgi:hypothetical protein